MRQQNSALRRMAEGGLIAAMYTALTLAVPVASFGLAQFRVSEILTVLPVFTPSAIPGLAVGCMVSNLVGLAMGANLAGAWDILFGTLATLVAARMTYGMRNIRIKGVPAPATLPPVVINALVVGLELTLVLLGGFSWDQYGMAVAYVAAGQFAACTVLGLILYSALERTGVARRMFL
ncbi:MAG TPA: QueT transporter family protein [Ruminococcaceae bacterium]|nr:QueT transporter family protein [Oscillospiraceae bacterium]